MALSATNKLVSIATALLYTDWNSGEFEIVYKYFVIQNMEILGIKPKL